MHQARWSAYVYKPRGNVDRWRCVGDELRIVQINLVGRLEYLGAAGQEGDA